ncbi:MAG: hypothetical protein LLG09_01300 [Negativicutes bacterium]|nr:hypothetical protein [Negativicutes bacterium]
MIKLPGLGIGVYLNGSRAQMESSVAQTAKIGMRWIFTSMHLPEQTVRRPLAAAIPLSSRINPAV